MGQAFGIIKSNEHYTKQVETMDILKLYAVYIAIRVGLVKQTYSWDTFDLIISGEYSISGRDLRAGRFRPILIERG